MGSGFESRGVYHEAAVVAVRRPPTGPSSTPPTNQTVLGKVRNHSPTQSVMLLSSPTTRDPLSAGRTLTGQLLVRRWLHCHNSDCLWCVFGGEEFALPSHPAADEFEPRPADFGSREYESGWSPRAGNCSSGSCPRVSQAGLYQSRCSLSTTHPHQRDYRRLPGQGDIGHSRSTSAICSLADKQKGGVTKLLDSKGGRLQSPALLRLHPPFRP